MREGHQEIGRLLCKPGASMLSLDIFLLDPEGVVETCVTSFVFVQSKGTRAFASVTLESRSTDDRRLITSNNVCFADERSVPDNATALVDSRVQDPDVLAILHQAYMRETRFRPTVHCRNVQDIVSDDLKARGQMIQRMLRDGELELSTDQQRMRYRWKYTLTTISNFFTGSAHRKAVAQHQRATALLLSVGLTQEQIDQSCAWKLADANSPPQR